jgi:hypothetical protein
MTSFDLQFDDPEQQLQYHTGTPRGDGRRAGKGWSALAKNHQIANDRSLMSQNDIDGVNNARDVPQQR